mmetsp:Transcript_24566/g.92826  ORF Transcript_24566/g.92826 Transcript_24566/m.92826 type:complete len:360 (-) Transcript_24566:2878-3957(-)
MARRRAAAAASRTLAWVEETASSDGKCPGASPSRLARPCSALTSAPCKPTWHNSSVIAASWSWALPSAPESSMERDVSADSLERNPAGSAASSPSPPAGDVARANLPCEWGDLGGDSATHGAPGALRAGLAVHSLPRPSWSSSGWSGGRSIGVPKSTESDMPSNAACPAIPPASASEAAVASASGDRKSGIGESGSPAPRCARRCSRCACARRHSSSPAEAAEPSGTRVENSPAGARHAKSGKKRWESRTNGSSGNGCSRSSGNRSGCTCSRNVTCITEPGLSAVEPAPPEAAPPPEPDPSCCEDMVRFACSAKGRDAFLIVGESSRIAPMTDCCTFTRTGTADVMVTLAGLICTCMSR